MNNANKADMSAILGKTGSGKSTELKHELKRLPKRLMVWDFKREYNHLPQTASLADVAAALKTAGKRGQIRLAFLPSMDAKLREKQLNAFCRMARAAGNLRFIAEELHFVTKPSHAPPGWSEVSCLGRADGLSVRGTSQRPAHMDKDFLGQCDRVVSFRLGYATDAKVVAEAMGPDIDYRELMQLQDLYFLEYDGKSVRRGRYTYVNNVPKKSYFKAKKST